MSIIKNAICAFACLIMGAAASFAANSTADANWQFVLPEYTHISPVTSPVLTAHVTDRTGNLYTPLHARFKVVTNAVENKQLYLNAKVVTDGGYEDAMFMQGGQVYVAFANLSKLPTSSSLLNCKLGAAPKDSPGVVAYPVTSVNGAENKYLEGKNRYEVTVKNGTTLIDINIGSNVLKTSFASNDQRGFYQAVLSLTEADI